MSVFVENTMCNADAVFSEEELKFIHQLPARIAVYSEKGGVFQFLTSSYSLNKFLTGSEDDFEGVSQILTTNPPAHIHPNDLQHLLDLEHYAIANPNREYSMVLQINSDHFGGYRYLRAECQSRVSKSGIPLFYIVFVDMNNSMIENKLREKRRKFQLNEIHAVSQQIQLICDDLRAQKNNYETVDLETAVLIAEELDRIYNNINDVIHR